MSKYIKNDAETSRSGKLSVLSQIVEPLKLNENRNGIIKHNAKILLEKTNLKTLNRIKKVKKVKTTFTLLNITN